jgi:hypothetical protein
VTVLVAAWAAADEPSPPPPPACPLESTVRIESGTPIWEDDPVVTPKKKAWEDALGGEVAARPSVRARMKGWPLVGTADRGVLPVDDRGFLARLARDTWRGLGAFTDRDNGLPVDHVLIDPATGGAPTGRVGTTPTTNVGLHVIAVVAASRLDLVNEADAIAAIARTLDTLDTLETHEVSSSTTTTPPRSSAPALHLVRRLGLAGRV